MQQSAASLVRSDSSSGSSGASAAAADQIYRWDEEAINKMRKERPWDSNVKHFQNCKVSALAGMKMLKHCLAGVEKGRKAGTSPIEVMGLMIGKAEGDSIIVMDACPLPVEGSETRVVADDAQVYMTQLMDSMELRRREGFVGWYHSHPFDVETYSHCHLSAIDVQTQTGWQMASGTWTAIVVDPLRSLARQEPEFGAYRVYPPKYQPPANECPDGSINADVSSRTTRWGLSYHRYYQLHMSYFMNSLGKQLVDVMSKNALWVRVLGSSSIMEPENRARFADRVKKASDRLNQVEAGLLTGGAGGVGMGMGMYSFASLLSGGVGPAAGGQRSGRRRRDPAGALAGASDDLTKGAQACCDLAIEQCKGHASQLIKDMLFNCLMRQEDRWRREEAEDEAMEREQLTQHKQATNTNAAAAATGPTPMQLG